MSHGKHAVTVELAAKKRLRKHAHFQCTVKVKIVENKTGKLAIAMHSNLKAARRRTSLLGFTRPIMHQPTNSISPQLPLDSATPIFSPSGTYLVIGRHLTGDLDLSSML